MNRSERLLEQTEIRMVQNWFEKLKRISPPDK